MNAYSKDLRLKVLAAVDRGIPRREVADLFGISRPTIGRYIKLKAYGGDVAPKPSPGRKAKILDDPVHKKVLCEQLEENDTATLEEHCQMFEKKRGVSISVATIRSDDESSGKKARVVFQKRSLGASERDEQRRGAFAEYVRSIVSERFVFVDVAELARRTSP